METKSLESAKARFIEAHSIFGSVATSTAQDYIDFWEEDGDFSEAELIERFNREASLLFTTAKHIVAGE